MNFEELLQLINRQALMIAWLKDDVKKAKNEFWIDLTYNIFFMITLFMAGVSLGILICLFYKL